MLSGADNVEFWTEQWIWDDVLKGIDIVVSTHQVIQITHVETFQLSMLILQVLLDALVHGFVQMKQLALLVFDEGARILKLYLSIHACLIAPLSTFLHRQSPIKQNTAGLLSCIHG